MSINYTTVWKTDYWMSSNGMYCGFNMPKAILDEKSETAHILPPYERRRYFLSDEYPAVPKNWVPSEGRKTSYFVPVKENSGMWLDFTKNEQHKYNVAIVISVQGINPITGMPCIDAGLEQYIDKCPKHDTSFGPNRYCKECGYKWPKQNYICTTGTPKGKLWLDGFRAANGIVRQYILTMDKIKGVANNIIKEDRVFAVGISFFLSVNPKPVVDQTILRSTNISTLNYPIMYSADCTVDDVDNSSYTSSDWKSASTQISNKSSKRSKSSIRSRLSKGCCLGSKGVSNTGTIGTGNTGTIGSQGVQYDCSSINIIDTISAGSARKAYIPSASASASASGSAIGGSQDLVRSGYCYSPVESDITDGIDEPVAPAADGAAPAGAAGAAAESDISAVRSAIESVDVQKLEVGAGANINQEIYDDPEPLEYWRKEPEALILINYALEDDCTKIVQAGRIPLEGHAEAFLKDIPKGNQKVEKVEKVEKTEEATV